MKRKIGILGGTLNPIHNAHLMIAESVRCEIGLDKVVFIPAANPPHKPDMDIVDAEHRYNMTVLATASNPYFDTSRIEMELGGKSYSLKTLRALTKRYGDSEEYYFITGSDAIQELDTWYHPEELLHLCHFIGTSRPGYEQDLTRIKDYFGEIGHKHIHQVVTHMLEISSTDIRQRVREGKSIRYYVPDPVEAYIQKEGLYR